MMKLDKKKEMTAQSTFSKEALLQSKRFKNRKDALAALIRDDEEITVAEAQVRLDKFLKRRVK